VLVAGWLVARQHIRPVSIHSNAHGAGWQAAADSVLAWVPAHACQCAAGLKTDPEQPCISEQLPFSVAHEQIASIGLMLPAAAPDAIDTSRAFSILSSRTAEGLLPKSTCGTSSSAAEHTSSTLAATDVSLRHTHSGVRRVVLLTAEDNNNVLCSMIYYVLKRVRTSSSSMVAGMLTMGWYSCPPEIFLPATTNAVFSWMPTCPPGPAPRVQEATCLRLERSCPPAPRAALLLTPALLCFQQHTHLSRSKLCIGSSASAALLATMHAPPHVVLACMTECDAIRTRAGLGTAHRLSRARKQHTPENGHSNMANEGE